MAFGFLIVRRLQPLMRGARRCNQWCNRDPSERHEARQHDMESALGCWAAGKATGPLRCEPACSHPGGLPRTMCARITLCARASASPASTTAPPNDVLFTAWLGQPGPVDVRQIASSVGAAVSARARRGAVGAPLLASPRPGESPLHPRGPPRPHAPRGASSSSSASAASVERWGSAPVNTMSGLKLGSTKTSVTP